MKTPITRTAGASRRNALLLLIAPVQLDGARSAVLGQPVIAVDSETLRSSIIFDARIWLDWDEPRAATSPGHGGKLGSSAIFVN